MTRTIILTAMVVACFTNVCMAQTDEETQQAENERRKAGVRKE